MTNDSGVDVAATLPSPFTRSQGSVRGDLGNNQLGANVPTNPYAIGTASDGVQVSLSLLALCISQ